MNKSYRYDLLGRSYHIGTSRRQVLKLGPINLRGYPTEFRSLSRIMKSNEDKLSLQNCKALEKQFLMSDDASINGTIRSNNVCFK